MSTPHKIRVLFLAPRLPFPMDTGGKIRTANLIRQAAKTCELHLACFSFGPDDYRRADQFSGGDFAVSLVPMTTPGPLTKSLKLLGDELPFSIGKYRTPAMSRLLKDLVVPGRFDLMHCDHIHMAHYRRDFPDLPALVDEHNVEFCILKRCVPVERNLFKRMIYAQQAARTERFERERLGEFTACSAVSEDDARQLRILTQNRLPVEVVPNGVDTDFFQVVEQGGCPLEDALVFTGSLDWLPNEDAVVHFCRDILPLIHQKRPEVKFYVVGKGAPDAVLRLAKSDPRIVVTGRVDDVRPFLERSKVFVAPLRIGGGTRLKILEAMAMKRPVVSTSVGAEGISYLEGKHLLAADRPQDFAARVLDLLNDPDRCAALGEAGRQLVVYEYDWPIIGKKLVGMYERILGRENQ